VSEEDSLQHRKYGKYLTAVEEMLARTDTPYALWFIVDAEDKYYAWVKILRTVVERLK
jgi:polyphosphate kinase 2 (PPK2 family)